jgi:hypothetical protein
VSALCADVEVVSALCADVDVVSALCADVEAQARHYPKLKRRLLAQQI